MVPAAASRPRWGRRRLGRGQVPVPARSGEGIINPTACRRQVGAALERGARASGPQVRLRSFQPGPCSFLPEGLTLAPITAGEWKTTAEADAPPPGLCFHLWDPSPQPHQQPGWGRNGPLPAVLVLAPPPHLYWAPQGPPRPSWAGAADVNTMWPAHLRMDTPGSQEVPPLTDKKEEARG